MLTCDTYFMNKTVNVFVNLNGRIDNFKGIVKDTNQGGVTVLITESDNFIFKKDCVVFMPFSLQFTMTADAPSEQVHACINDLNEMYKKPQLPPAPKDPV